MIWRCKDYTIGRFRSLVGEEWTYGCCPLCKKENNYIMPIKCCGNVRNLRTDDVLLVFQCGHCGTFYIWNHTTFQLVQACAKHWYPVLIRNCKRCIDDLTAECLENMPKAAATEDGCMSYEC